MAKIIDNFIDRHIGQVMLDEALKRDAEHRSSGKLSASMLNDPLQWQVLKVLGVEKEPLDEYAVRKFHRGRDIEAWVLKFFGNDSNQGFVEYRGVVGLVDAMADTSSWDFPHGIVPVEVKSVANAKFKRIEKQGPDKGHILQAVLYGLAKGTEWVAVLYVASDDLRVLTYWIKVEDYKDEVDTIITDFDNAMKSGVIPVFVPRETWQGNPKYNKYVKWADMTEKELLEKSKELFR